MELYQVSEAAEGLSPEQIREALLASLQGKTVRKALIIPPDYTRLHSNAGFITNTYYKLLSERGAEVWVLPALGTHTPMTEEQTKEMYGTVPAERFLIHNWRRDVVSVGEVPAEFVSRVTEGLWQEKVTAELNRLLLDPSFDLILSVGQVVPHEVIGMSNHSKNLFVGTGGSDMINKSHMIGAVYGMERMMGRDNTPVRQIFDYCCEHFLRRLPITYVLTVTAPVNGRTATRGVFIGEGRECLTEAVCLSQRLNIDRLPSPIRKCVVYLDPAEFHSTWLGNKAVYRTRMALADGAELLILAPGVQTFGEDPECDRLIRKYGYRGRLHTLEEFRKQENADLRSNMGAAAHLIHGSSDGRFRITYAVRKDFMSSVRDVGYEAADIDEMLRKYPPDTMPYGYSGTGEDAVFFIPNPALGLWMSEDRLADR